MELRVGLQGLEKGVILAFGEVYQNKLHPASLEILTPLKEIAKRLDKKLVLLCFLSDLKRFNDKVLLEKCLADEVWIVEHKELEDFRDDLYGKVIVEIVKEVNPKGVFFSATLFGCALAPRVAGALNLGLCAHVNHIEIIDGKIVFSRPTYGENIIARLICKTEPVMATISVGIFGIKEEEKEVKFKLLEMPETFDWKSKIKLRKVSLSSKQPTFLSTAKIVVAGGRGLKTKENFQKLFELAQLLGAEVGATRPVCYEGWVGQERMIGISGISVKPKIYLGFGISGALQHVIGMEKSEFIVAINTDKEAPLVKMAHLSLIGDAPKILDLLIKKLKARKQAFQISL